MEQLLEKKKGGGTIEDLECLSQILKTCGRILDTERAKSRVDQYFGRIQMLSESEDLPLRIRFMLIDVLELRQNQWIPRGGGEVAGPKTIQEIRDEAARDGYYFPQRVGHKGNQGNQNSFFLEPMKSRAGLDEVFGSLPMGRATLGTGPGVIDFFGAETGSRGVGVLSSGGAGKSYSHSPYSIPGSGGSGGGSGGGNSRSVPGQNGGPMLNYSVAASGALSGGAGIKNSAALPPRMQKKYGGSSGGGGSGGAAMLDPDAVSLRPSLESMTMSAIKPAAHTTNSLLSPLTATTAIKEPPILIKKGKKGPQKEEIIRGAQNHFETFFTTRDVSGCLSDYKRLRVPNRFSTEILVTAINLALSSAKTNDGENGHGGLANGHAEEEGKTQYHEGERRAPNQLGIRCPPHVMVNLLQEMLHNNLINATHIQEAVKSVVQQRNSAAAIAATPSGDESAGQNLASMAAFLGELVYRDLSHLNDLASLCDGGKNETLFCMILVHLQETRGKPWLNKAVQESKVNLLQLLPSEKQNKEELASLLETHGISFLQPLLRIQTDLVRALNADPNPTAFYKWIKENVEAEFHSSPPFVMALVGAVVKHVHDTSTSSGLGEGTDRKNEEKMVLGRFQSLLRSFIGNNTSLQLSALYAVQVFCHSLDFPKGMFLRWFVNLYDLEIIEEDAFLQWREDLNADFPGKQKGLFQVNQWLMWLQEAESDEEGSEEEADDDD
ncbi:unnamed protein product [Cyprideis torosa]|uniref:Eukaryotic translation initiation factor 4 gamma 2 n=1 Tax=Cyprideis torosa TaxID=163714 RepID=A0A7R8ZHD9_9CRUS|nr:unnamed protein product [Cyprideis torosa]CAG0883461.1 unnamed protein product [Cyprideis torosa]